MSDKFITLIQLVCRDWSNVLSKCQQYIWPWSWNWNCGIKTMLLLLQTSDCQISEGLRNLITVLTVYNAVFLLFHRNQIQPVNALTYSVQLTGSYPFAATE